MEKSECIQLPRKSVSVDKKVNNCIKKLISAVQKCEKEIIPVDGERIYIIREVGLSCRVSDLRQEFKQKCIVYNSF